MAFDIDFIERGIIKQHIRKFLLYPEHWKDMSNHISYTLKWKCYRFNRNNIDRIPNQKGIYCFIVKPKLPNFFETRYLFYVGQTTRTLKIRFKEYLKDQSGQGKPRSKVFEMLNFYKDNLFFYFVGINGLQRINYVEQKLLNIFVPHINSDIPIAKVKPELRNIYE